jgi:hypothetical protein
LSSLRTLRWASLERRVGGRGRHRNCLNLSRELCASCWPLKSQMVKPGSGWRECQRQKASVSDSNTMAMRTRIRF